MARVEGIDYSPDGVNAAREEMITVRNEALKQAAFPEAVLFSHVIAYLHEYAELMELEAMLINRKESP